MTHEKEIKELIEAGEKARDVTWRYSGRLRAITSPLEPFEPIIVNVVSLPEYENNGKFIEKAANSRIAIKAMYEENLRLKERIAELEKGDEWMPIDDAPKDGTTFLIYDSGEYRECWWSGDEVIGWTSYQTEPYLFPCYFPTHWKPLPTPPQENE